MMHLHYSYLFFWFCRQYNVDYKLDTYLKIARLYLEDDDPVQAEAYINRASLLQNESTNEQLQIHYKVHQMFISSFVHKQTRTHIQCQSNVWTRWFFPPPPSSFGCDTVYDHAIILSSAILQHSSVKRCKKRAHSCIFTLCEQTTEIPAVINLNQRENHSLLLIE